MNLSEALHGIAVTYALSETDLAAYITEDTIGGYHEDPALCKWPMGSVWEVEAQIVYALVRALKPKVAVEIGSYYGCSTYHIAEAMLKNGAGKLISIDIAFMYQLPPRYAEVVEQMNVDLFQYHMPKGRVGFMFEDAMHTADSVAYMWQDFKESALPGAIIVSHDAMHQDIGHSVREGMSRVTNEFTTWLITPGKCGLGMWRKSDAS